jgi:hypothetical protein
MQSTLFDVISMKIRLGKRENLPQYEFDFFGIDDKGY